MDVQPEQTLRLETLPNEILSEIYAHLGVADLCRFFLNLELSKFTARLADHLKTLVVFVTPDELSYDNSPWINFSTYARLPPCEILVRTPCGQLDLTKWHLNQVKYSQLTLLVQHNAKYYLGVDFTGINGHVSKVRIRGRIELNPNMIPRSVRELSLDGCRTTLPLNFEHLTYLTHFKAKRLTPVGTLVLPLLVTDIEICDNLRLTFNATLLPNLKNLKGPFLYNIKGTWVRLSCVSSANYWSPEMWRKMTTTDGICFKEMPSTQLQEVVLHGQHHGVDATNVFTDNQLSQLTMLRAQTLSVRDMDMLFAMKVLQIKFDKVLHRFTRLPPNVDEFVMVLSQPVTGIPSQLKVFGYKNFDNLEVNDIVIDSKTVRYVNILRARTVTINCVKLTRLAVEAVMSVGYPNAPNVVNLKVDGTKVPLKLFPRLAHLSMRNVNQAVEISHLLKSVTLDKMKLSRVALTAEQVELLYCEFWSNFKRPQIEAQLLNLLDTVLDRVDGIKCQYLFCGKRGRIVSIPRMVEKLYISHLNDQWVENCKGRRGGTPILARLERCDRLKSVEISHADFRNLYHDGITFPASIRLVTLSKVKWGDHAKLRFTGLTHLVHLKCDSAATVEQLGYPPDSPPPSLVCNGTVTFQPQLLPPLKSRDNQ